MSEPQLLCIEPRTAREDFEAKRDALAKGLYELYYGEGSWGYANELEQTYLLDAEDVLLSNPHLLTLPTRVLISRNEGTRVQLEARLSLMSLAVRGLTGDWAHFADEMKDADDFENWAEHE